MVMLQTISVIIRSKNEAQTIQKTLEMMKQQTVQPLQIILVDNGSSDSTVEIAREFGCEIVHFTPSVYNHAAACNEGVKQAKGEIIFFTNGHSVPISNKWLESGLHHFKDPKVAGVFGSETFPSHATRMDRWMRKLAEFYYPGLKKVYTYNKASLTIGPGLLATMSAAIRRSLWEKHHFDEQVSGSGAGEDTEWAFYFLRRGYKIVVDPDFSVFHSHQVNLKKFIMRNINFYYSYFLAYQKSKRD
jgi:rhamnosyltransferase